MVRFSGWDSKEAAKSVLRLGGCIATNSKEVTHLVMPTLLRTPNLLCCLPTVKFILNPRWIQDSVEHGKFLDEHPYVLKETELEKKMDFNLHKLLSTPNRDQIFRGRTFYITPSVVPSCSFLRETVECNGGKVTSKQKSLKAIQELNQNQEHAYVIISCPADLYLLTDAIKNKIGEFLIGDVLIMYINYKSSFVFSQCRNLQY